MNYDSEAGSFRCFRDKDLGWLEQLFGRRQMFIDDLAAALRPARHALEGSILELLLSRGF